MPKVLLYLSRAPLGPYYLTSLEKGAGESNVLSKPSGSCISNVGDILSAQGLKNNTVLPFAVNPYVDKEKVSN